MMSLNRWFARLRFRTKLIIYYVLLITLPIISISYAYYKTSSGIILKNASDSLQEVVIKNNQYTDIVFNRIKDQSLSLLTDSDLFHLFEKPLPTDLLEIFQMDRKVSDILNKYFASETYIDSVQLVTSNYSFGGMASLTSRSTLVTVRPNKLKSSALYREATIADGKMIWFPTYDFAKQFDQKELENMDPRYRFVFSAAQILKSSIVVNGVVNKWESGTEYPMLLINFNESFFDTLKGNENTMDGSHMYVVSQNGDIVASPEQSNPTNTMIASWLKDAVKGKVGSAIYEEDGEKLLICYDTSAVTGWLNLLVVPYDQLLSNLPQFHKYSIYIVGILLMISITVAYMIAGRLTNPIKKLLVAIHLTGNGDFSTKIPEQSDLEFAILIKKFNQMNDRISDLIDENYKSKLREKEAEIMALNLQLNPHFLYNTLNIINWMALDKDEEEISKMLVSLSTMLQYTVKNKQEIVLFTDDLIWLKSYIHIMEQRYCGLFETEYELNLIPISTKVPKMFLQPIVENAIIHGLSSKSQGGMLRISGRELDGMLEFAVTDNGKGIHPDTIASLTKPDATGVGITNVQNRIKLLYGEMYGIDVSSKLGEWTQVKIRIPKQY
ncbi:sensor histidine kinase [Paenibacillus oryzisoli]|uniref:sensor histidine kinase n=1 Tax=Paenibacillus oryzisoli TaxID=1850517 RepID=UPI003D2980D3